MSRYLCRLVAAIALTLSALVALAPGAAAHDELVSTSPVDGASGEAPAQVVLRFVDTVLSVGSQVRVVGPAGDATDAAPAVAKSTVTQRLQPELPPGAYRVDWRAVAGDGHPVTGSFTFTVTAASTSTPGPTTEATPTAPAVVAPISSPSPTASGAPTAPGSPLDELGTGAQAALGIGAVLALAGAAAVAYRRLRDQGGG